MPTEETACTSGAVSWYSNLGENTAGKERGGVVYLVTPGTSMRSSYSSIRLWAQPSPNGIQLLSVLKG